MKNQARMLLLWLAIIPLGLKAQGITDVIAGLERLTPYSAEAQVEIKPPGVGDNVVYDARLAASAPSDTASSVCDFIVEYRRVGDDREGRWCFDAFVDSVLYRFNGSRFTETPFTDTDAMPRLRVKTLFDELLPASLALQLSRAVDAPNMDVDVVPMGPDIVDVTVRERYYGAVVYEQHLRVSLPTYSPLSLRKERPDDVAGMESWMEVKYLKGASPAQVVDADMLWRLQPDVMSRFSGDNLAPENFVGYPFPGLTLPDTEGGRFTYEPRYPTLLILIDDENPNYGIERIIEDVRDVYPSSPYADELDILYVMLPRYIDAIPASRSPRRNEHILVGGEGLARQLDSTFYPLMMFINDEGVVERVTNAAGLDPKEVLVSILK